MSYNPGLPGGFKRGPVAVVDGRPVNPDRIRHDHSFAGPGYPIAHPGIFPHNPEAENWTVQEWLEFNWREPWGDEDWEDAYEEAVDEGTRDEIEFPEVWEDRFDREEPRIIVEYNLELIEEVRAYLLSLGIESRLTYDADSKKANLWATIGPSDRGGIVLSGHTSTCRNCLERSS